MEPQNTTIRKNPAIIRQNVKEENPVPVRVALRMTAGIIIMTKIHFDHIEN